MRNLLIAAALLPPRWRSPRPCSRRPSPPAAAAPNPPPNEQVIEPAVPRRDVRCRRSRTTTSSSAPSSARTPARTSAPASSTARASAITSPRTSSSRACTARPRSATRTSGRSCPGGVFPTTEEKLDYYNLSVGYNILPGEVFFGSKYAKASALYLIAGVGSTKFLEQSKQTINFGLGLRVFLKDWAAIQVDLRDHMYSLDLLGQRKSTQNLELTAGVDFLLLSPWP